MVYCLPTGVSGAPVEDCAFNSTAEAAPKDGPLLAAQHCGSDSADVHVCPSGSLDGLHLVYHRQEGNGGQHEQLGYWSVAGEILTANLQTLLLL